MILLFHNNYEIAIVKSNNVYKEERKKDKVTISSTWTI